LKIAFTGTFPLVANFFSVSYGKKHIRSSAITRFDFRLEFVFFHCFDFLTAGHWSLGIKPLSLIGRYPSDYSRFVGNPEVARPSASRCRPEC
jgi:hypothetical protein